MDVWMYKIRELTHQIIDELCPKVRESESLGYILLKPIYKISLSTVNLIDHIPDLEIYTHPKDPRIKLIWAIDRGHQ